jgi:methyltransferase
MGVSQIAYLGLLAAVGIGRLIELRISKGNQKRMAEQGARPVPDMHFFWMVLWHGGTLLAAAWEVVFLQRPFLPLLAFPMLMLFVLSNLMRWWVIRTLAGHWNVQVMNSTALGVVTHGPYRWIRHPNYVAVFLELIALPLIHTAWLTAALAALSTAVILRQRLRVEESVLLANASYQAAMGSKPRFIPRLF